MRRLLDFSFIFSFIVSAITLSVVVRPSAQPGQPTPAQQRTREVVTHGDVTIDLIAEGRGPLVVLLPSLGRDSEEFDQLASRIAVEGFRVLRPQPRGYGRSAGPMESLTLHDAARDVAAVIEHERAGPAIIAGHAYGHFVAKMTAVDFPEMVRAVVLVAAAQKNIDPQVRRWLAIATDPLQPEPERLKHLQLVFFAPGHNPAVWLTGFHPSVQRAEEIARDATPQREFWSAGTAPVLDVQAEYDPFRPRNTADELVNEFGTGRVSVVLVRGASHALPIENPSAVAEAIVSYARRLPAAAPAVSREVRVLCSNAIKPAVEKILAEAERTIGRPIAIQYSSSAALKRSIEGGEAFDLAILTPAVVHELIERGAMAAGTETDLASAALAVGIRAGAPTRDTSTPEAMKRTLLASQSITFTREGAARAAITRMLTDLGVQGTLESRIVLQAVPGRAAETVASGENELVFAPVSEILSVRGVEVLGLFPHEFQSPIVTTAAIGTRARHSADARALISFLTGPIAAAAMKAAGLEPAQKPQQAAGVPRFEVDPAWPKSLPNNWTFGEFSGVAVDSHDHVWINQRPKTLADDEKYLTANPPVGDCCAPGPPIMEFDAEGNFVQGWGGPGAGYEWPENEHGITVDYRDNVWVGGNGPKDSHILKFTKSGRFLLQIGHLGKGTGSNDTENLGRPSKMQVSPRTNELFVSDGYGNRRVMVFDAETGRYKRHWGAYGNRPDDAASRQRVAEGPGPQQFNLVHGLRLSNDDLVYVGDRLNNRIQVFRTDGTFVKEGFIARATLGNGTAYDVDLSPDPGQRFLYVPDGTNNHVWILNRDTLEIVGRFGRQGRYAGQFHHVHSIAVDSKGNIYTAETQGKRVQKFVFKGVS